MVTYFFVTNILSFQFDLTCLLLLGKKKNIKYNIEDWHCNSFSLYNLRRALLFDEGWLRGKFVKNKTKLFSNFNVEYLITFLFRFCYKYETP